MSSKETTIKWTDADGGLQVVKAVSEGKSFTVEVGQANQVRDWSKVFKESERAAGAAPSSPAALDGGDEVTIAIIQGAVALAAIITLAGLLAYAIGRGYRIAGKKTKTTWNFEFAPGRS